MKQCSILDCERSVWARGWCQKHLRRWQRHGHTNPTQTVGEGSTFSERFWNRVALTSNLERCWEWLGATNCGYGVLKYEDGTKNAHRVAWFLVNGEFPTQHLLHSCDNRLCVNPNHLREGTDAENMRDCVTRNRQAKGQELPQTKLTPTDVRKIRRLLASGVYQREVGRRFGVYQGTISKIARKETWTHVT